MSQAPIPSQPTPNKSASLNTDAESRNELMPSAELPRNPKPDNPMAYLHPDMPLSVHAFRALPASLTDRELATLPPQSLEALQRPGSARGGRRSKMSMVECIEALRTIHDPSYRSVRNGEYIPPPPMTQTDFEREIYGLAKSGAITEAGAEKLLEGMARAAARRAQEAGPLGMGQPSHPEDPFAMTSEEESQWEKKQRLYKALEASGIPQCYWGLRIHENPFLTEAGAPYDQSPLNKKAFRSARRLAHDWEPGRAGLTFQSASRGVSKTLLAAAVSVYVCASRPGPDGHSRADIRFVTASDLFGMWAASNGATWERNHDVLSTERVWQENAVRPDLLVIDDLGTEPYKLISPTFRTDVGDWVREQFYRLADHRHSHKLTTVITTQLDQDALTARYGGHVVSRLLARSPIVSIEESPDYRQDAVVDASDPFSD